MVTPRLHQLLQFAHRHSSHRLPCEPIFCGTAPIVPCENGISFLRFSWSFGSAGFTGIAKLRLRVAMLTIILLYIAYGGLTKRALKRFGHIIFHRSTSD